MGEVALRHPAQKFPHRHGWARGRSLRVQATPRATRTWSRDPWARSSMSRPAGGALGRIGGWVSCTVWVAIDDANCELRNFDLGSSGTPTNVVGVRNPPPIHHRPVRRACGGWHDGVVERAFHTVHVQRSCCRRVHSRTGVVRGSMCRGLRITAEKRLIRWSPSAYISMYSPCTLYLSIHPSGYFSS